MIECPRCGNSNTSRPRSGSKRPRKVRANVVIRQHVCQDCGMEFRSYTIVPTDRVLIDLLADALEGVA